MTDNAGGDERGFVMQEELREGKAVVDSWPLCEVLLVDDSQYPGWLVLVPRRAGVQELMHLSREDQVLLIMEIERASLILVEAVNPDKLNVGILGNVVPQLHVHIVPRRKTDRTWPAPVWGGLPAIPFTEEDLSAILAKIKAGAADGSLEVENWMEASRISRKACGTEKITQGTLANHLSTTSRDS